MSNFYTDISELFNSRFDAMIVTGTEPKRPDLREEPYWAALVEVLSWAEENTSSAVLSCLAAHEKVVVEGLTSEAARAFIETLPSVESLMPALSIAELADEARPPIAEQLVSSNALRQRRHRDRQKALREGAEASRNGPITVDEAEAAAGAGAGEEA